MLFGLLGLLGFIRVNNNPIEGGTLSISGMIGRERKRDAIVTGLLMDPQ